MYILCAGRWAQTHVGAGEHFHADARTDLIQGGNCDLGSIIVSRVEACDPS